MHPPRSNRRPDPRSRAVQSRRISRLPAFTPVPLRAGAGWTPCRQAEFLGLLAETRCVKRAAERTGMSREGAYRLRRKPGAEDFAAAWDAIVGAPATPRASPARVTPETLFRRIRLDSYRPIMRGGRFVGTVRSPDDRAVAAALARFDRCAPRDRDRRAAPKGRGQ